MNVAIYRFRVQLARIADDVDRSADDVEIQPTVDTADIDVRRSSLHPQPDA